MEKKDEIETQDIPKTQTDNSLSWTGSATKNNPVLSTHQPNEMNIDGKHFDFPQGKLKTFPAPATAPAPESKIQASQNINTETEFTLTTTKKLRK